MTLGRNIRPLIKRQKCPYTAIVTNCLTIAPRRVCFCQRRKKRVLNTTIYHYCSYSCSNKQLKNPAHALLFGRNYMRSSIAISQQLIQARHRKTIRKNIIVLSVLSSCFFVDLNEAITCLLFFKKKGFV